jgi:hypothetical protein
MGVFVGRIVADSIILTPGAFIHKSRFYCLASRRCRLTRLYLAAAATGLSSSIVSGGANGLQSHKRETEKGKKKKKKKL